MYKTRTLYLLSLDPSAPPFFLRLAASETKRSEGRKRKINKKRIGVRDRVSSARVASRGGDLRACVRGEVRRRTGARVGDAAAAAANGARSRDAPRARTRSLACLQIIIIRPVAPPLHRAPGYARYGLRTAVVAFGGIRFGVRSKLRSVYLELSRWRAIDRYKFAAAL